MAAERLNAEWLVRSALTAPVLAAGELTLAAGELPLAAGELTLAAGELPLAAGELTLAAGELPLAAGELPLAAGENLKGSHRRLKVIVARFMGNAMPPLQGVDQNVLNARHILNSETQDSDCSAATETSQKDVPATVEFSSNVWLVNRVANQTAKWRLIDALHSRGDTLVIDIPLTRTLLRDATKRLVYATSIGAARNMALRESRALGADWTLLLDGNMFLTDEAKRELKSGIARAEISNAKYLFLPTYRLMRPANPRSGSVLPILMSNSTLDSLFVHVQRMEAQVAFRYDAPKLFAEHLLYGNRDKYALIDALQKEDTRTNVHCSWADVEFGRVNLNHTLESQEVTGCGYVVRLPYHSDYSVKCDEFGARASLRPVSRRHAVSVLSTFMAESIGLTTLDRFPSFVLSLPVVCYMLYFTRCLPVFIKVPNSAT